MVSKVAVYCRLSKEDIGLKENEVSESIQNQKKMLIDYSLKQGWDIYGIYCDEDFKGSDNNRPDWNRLLKDAQNGKFSIVLCKSQSRFSRLQEITEKYINGKFSEWNVRFVSLVDSADTEVKSNKKTRQINGLINEWYIEDLSENIRAVFKSKMMQGQCLCAFAPIGYKKDPQDRHHLIVDKEYAPVVKQIFLWNYEGLGGQKIARRLNDISVPVPRKIQEIKGLRKEKLYSEKDNGIWSARAVTQILNNRVYCGDTVSHITEKISYKSEIRKSIPESDWIVVENTHEPIISKEIFFALKKQKSLRVYSRDSLKKHPLAGIVKCHCCMKPMQKNHSGTVDYLRCRDKYSYSEKMKCNTPNIRTDIITKLIFYDFIRKVASKELSAVKTEKLSGKKELIFLKKELEKVEAELSRRARAIGELYLDQANGIITKEQFCEYNHCFIKEKEKYEEKKSTLTEKIEGFNSENSRNEQLEMKEKTIFNKIISKLIKEVVWGEIDNDSGRRKLVVSWSF